MDDSTLEQISRNHSTASWAIWSESFPRRDSVEALDDKNRLVEFVKKRSEDLRPDLILVGLNPSTEKPRMYSNFHSIKARHQDAWLRVFVEESDLEGAYMTDISGGVHQRGEDVSFNNEPIQEFSEQLHRLGPDSFDIICWGRKAYNFLKQYSTGPESELKHSIFKTPVEIENIAATVYSVYHYSQVNPDNLETLREQLQFLEQKRA